MATGRRSWAYPLAALAALGLAVSLWLPWYSFTIPAPLLNGAEQLSGQAGILGPLLHQGAEVLRNLGPQQMTAWDILKQIPVVVLLAAGAGGGLAALAASGRARGTGRLIALSGGVAAVVTSFRALSPPNSMLHAAWGAWFAVACAIALLVGGALAAQAEETEEGWTPSPSPLGDTAASWSTASSVPPPGA